METRKEVQKTHERAIDVRKAKLVVTWFDQVIDAKKDDEKITKLIEDYFQLENFSEALEILLKHQALSQGKQKIFEVLSIFVQHISDEKQEYRNLKNNAKIKKIYDLSAIFYNQFSQLEDKQKILNILLNSLEKLVKSKLEIENNIAFMSYIAFGDAFKINILKNENTLRNIFLKHIEKFLSTNKNFLECDSPIIGSLKEKIKKLKLVEIDECFEFDYQRYRKASDKLVVYKTILKKLPEDKSKNQQQIDIDCYQYNIFIENFSAFLIDNDVAWKLFFVKITRFLKNIDGNRLVGKLAEQVNELEIQKKYRSFKKKYDDCWISGKTECLQEILENLPEPGELIKEDPVILDNEILSKKINIDCYQYLKFIKYFREQLQGSSELSGIFYGKVENFLFICRYNWGMIELEDSLRLNELSNELSSMIAKQKPQIVLSGHDSKKESNLSPVASVKQKQNPKITSIGYVWYGIWKAIFLPLTIAEFILRLVSWSYGEMPSNPAERAFVTIFAFPLKLLFWPEKLIEEHPTLSRWMRGLNIIAWVTIAFLLPPVLGQLGLVISAEFFPPLYSALTSINLSFEVFSVLSALVLMTVYNVVYMTGNALFVKEAHPEPVPKHENEKIDEKKPQHQQSIEYKSKQNENKSSLLKEHPEKSKPKTSSKFKKKSARKCFMFFGDHNPVRNQRKYKGVSRRVR